MPWLFVAFGSTAGALLAMYPGLLLILWRTGGWFASITPLGYVIIYGTNTLSYALLIFAAFRLCRFLTNRYS
jgi:hypothetical protein